MRVQPESHRRPQDLQSYALLLSYAPANILYGPTLTGRGYSRLATQKIDT